MFHPLNPFPDLLVLSLFSPFILRIFIGLLFINLGFLKLTKEKQRWVASFEALRIKKASYLVGVAGTLEFVGGFFLLLGFYTQIVALVFLIITFLEIFAEKRESTLLTRDIFFYIMIFVVLVSLMLTGAGLFALDMPL